MATLTPINCKENTGWYAKVTWQLSQQIWAIVGKKQGNVNKTTVGGCEMGYTRFRDHIFAEGFCKFIQGEKRPGFRINWENGYNYRGYDDTNYWKLGSSFDYDYDDADKFWSDRQLPPKEAYTSLGGGQITGTAMRFYDFSLILEHDDSWLGKNGQVPFLILAEQDDVDAFIEDLNKDVEEQNKSFKNESMRGSWTDDLDDGNCPPCFYKSDVYGFYGYICNAIGIQTSDSYYYYSLNTWAYDRDIIQRVCELEDKNPWRQAKTRDKLTTYQLLNYSGNIPIDKIKWEWLKDFADNIGGSKQNYNWVDTEDEDNKQSLWIPDENGNPDPNLGGRPIEVTFHLCDCPEGTLKCFNSDGTFCCIDCCEDIGQPVVKMFEPLMNLV